MHGPIVSDAVLATARLRGVSLEILGRVLGVSRQRISQRLMRWENTNGKTIKFRAKIGHKGRRPFICKTCKKVAWRNPFKLANYCSNVCSGKARRLISDEVIEQVIKQRLAGRTWRAISREIGCGTQPLQARVWQLLHNRGQLTRKRCIDIWCNGSYNHAKPSWHWLEQRTGWIPK